MRRETAARFRRRESPFSLGKEFFKIRPRQDLNLRPEAPEASTLSTELRGQMRSILSFLRMLCQKISPEGTTYR